MNDCDNNERQNFRRGRENHRRQLAESLRPGIAIRIGLESCNWRAIAVSVDQKRGTFVWLRG